MITVRQFVMMFKIEHYFVLHLGITWIDVVSSFVHNGSAYFHHSHWFSCHLTWLCSARGQFCARHSLPLRNYEGPCNGRQILPFWQRLKKCHILASHGCSSRVACPCQSSYCPRVTGARRPLLGPTSVWLEPGLPRSPVTRLPQANRKLGCLLRDLQSYNLSPCFPGAASRTGPSSIVLLYLC
jgi:hypothetical protein